MNANSQTAARFITVTMGLVVGLTFLFGFGNVLNLALKLQVPTFIAPLVAPAVDLTVLGLLVGMRHLALSGARDEVLRPARRLLVAASVLTLLLNVADPVFAGQWDKAAFDSVGPLLLIGWADTGPGLLRALSAGSTEQGSVQPSTTVSADRAKDGAGHTDPTTLVPDHQWSASPCQIGDLDEELVERTRQADAAHWRGFRRPISAETLRKQLRIGARKSRVLVAVVRQPNVK